MSGSPAEAFKDPRCTSTCTWPTMEWKPWHFLGTKAPYADAAASRSDLARLICLRKTVESAEEIKQSRH